MTILNEKMSQQNQMVPPKLKTFSVNYETDLEIIWDVTNDLRLNSSD